MSMRGLRWSRLRALALASTALIVCMLSLPVLTAVGATVAAVGTDSRLRVVLYSADEVYRLPGYIGYQIDLEFEPGERFIGLGTGDIDGLTFMAQTNHLFIKPKAPNVRTNLTVLTNRRTYHFDYATLRQAPGSDLADVVYALRFLYPASPTGRDMQPRASSAARGTPAASAQILLPSARPEGRRNSNYWYCGRPELQPLEAWDDGVHTHLRFGPRAELPAVFVRNDDGSESLLNFNVEQDEVVVHRIARRFVVRRGKLSGCIVNRGFAGSGAALPSETLSPQIERALREADDEAVH